MKFNEILRNLRKEKNLELRKVANDLSIPYNTFSRWERGECEPNIDTLNLLANYYHVSLDYLLRGKEKETYEITKEDFIEFTNFKKEFDKMYKMLDLIESKNTIRNLNN